MSLPANTQDVPAGDWILSGYRRRCDLRLELRSDDGEVVALFAPGDFAQRFGRRDAELRGRGWAWVDADKWPHENARAEDFGDAVLVNTMTGARIPLAEAPHLLGCDVGAAGVAAIVTSAVAPAPTATPMQPAGLYTTNKKKPHLIPGKSREWMLDHLPSMKPYGARKLVRDWTIRPDDFERWRMDQDTAKVRASAPEQHEVIGARTIAERTLARAGLRPTKEGA